jgi:cytochrome d ubiquinol oxidase subunit I
VETGWIVRCVGRQPWTVYNQIRTVDAASHLPAGEILTSLIGITAIYVVFLVSALYFGSRIIRQGPNLNLPLPGTQEEKVTSPELNPRSLEAQQ